MLPPKTVWGYMFKTLINHFLLGRDCIELPLHWVCTLPLRCKTERNINNSPAAVKMYLAIHPFFPPYRGFFTSLYPFPKPHKSNQQNRVLRFQHAIVGAIVDEYT
jgi:hypothetical protein